VDEAVGWARRRAGASGGGYVNAVLRAVLRDLAGPAAGAADERRDVPREDGSCLRLRAAVFADPRHTLAENLAQRYSMPAWLVARWLARWGEERCRAVLRAGITRPPVTLRARRGRDELARHLAGRGIPFEAGPGEETLRLGAGEASIEDLVDSGEAAVQDATSQRVAPLVGARAGARVLDLCAAPGGKALQLADRMGSGEVVACDVDPERVRGLEALASAARGVTFTVRGVPAAGPLPFPPASFDGVLVDAPCSNTGVLRRRVEARWRLEPDDVPALAALQIDLLERAMPLVRPGGRLVYSTCSLEPEEDEDVLAAILAAHPSWRGAQAFRAWPGREQDGGWAAVLTAPA
jgi:16S rRNA (cytosine967-C5)-methyltransferase